MQLSRDTTESAAVSTSETPRRLAPAAVMAGFLPAFRHLETGEVRLCKMEDGRLSREHFLDGLPDHWVLDRDQKGRPASLVYAIEPGFVRGIDFWSLGDFTHPALDG
ncbi:hypothetical protein [Thiocystis violacea]|uniref:hypothetical protein n=1 Tax=Thiocystis violacea TaxID=13725 RepID=UPI001905C29F|nr:hypothetical protein [Thiocystis violacea]MBK1721335.1 hypothetical protein [Thiocystis violacea]